MHIRQALTPKKQTFTPWHSTQSETLTVMFLFIYLFYLLESLLFLSHLYIGACLFFTLSLFLNSFFLILTPDHPPCCFIVYNELSFMV